MLSWSPGMTVMRADVPFLRWDRINLGARPIIIIFICTPSNILRQFTLSKCEI